METNASKKLIVSIVLLVGLALVVGAGALLVNYRLGEAMYEATAVKARMRDVACRMGQEAAGMEAAERGLALALVLEQEGQAEAMQAQRGRARESFSRLLAEFRAGTGHTAAEAAAIEAAWENSRAMQDELGALIGQQKTEPALALLSGKLLPQLSDLSATARKLAENQTVQMNEVARGAAEMARAGFWIMLVLDLVAFVLGAVVFLMVKRLAGMLRETVAELSNSAQQLNLTSQEVGSYSLSLSRSAGDQAASLEETSASTEEIHSMTRSNADNSKQAADRMQEAAQKVEETNRALADMIHSMNEISTSSSKISKIIKVIDEIAFQTNILALNAAVEAARAGEAGMGFAVVADEVRSLAQRSAQAAKDTTQLIEESIGSATKGKLKLDEVARASEAVSELVKAVSGLMQEVRLGSEEQERGIEQIAKAVSQMERVTQQVAANAEEGAAAGEELRRHAATVGKTVDALRMLVGGKQEAGQMAGPRVGQMTLNAAVSATGLTAGRGASVSERLQAVRQGRPTAGGGGAAVAERKDPFPMDDSFEEF
jgi:methyl-accepting chemotaxis protein